MPRGNGTGPAGMGPMTGRGAGYCAGFGSPGFTNPAGRGLGFGRGGGRGWRHWYAATGLTSWQRAAAGWFPPAPQPPSREQELEMLKMQSEALSRELEAIRGRIAEVESAAKQ